MLAIAIFLTNILQQNIHNYFMKNTDIVQVEQPSGEIKELKLSELKLIKSEIKVLPFEESKKLDDILFLEDIIQIILSLIFGYFTVCVIEYYRFMNNG